MREINETHCLTTLQEKVNLHMKICKWKKGVCSCANTWDEKFLNGSSSAGESKFSLVTKWGYRLVKEASLDGPPYIWAPARNIWVLRLKPRAASISTASSGVNGQRPSDLSSSGEGNLQRKRKYQHSYPQSGNIHPNHHETRPKSLKLTFRCRKKGGKTRWNLEI